MNGQKLAELKHKLWGVKKTLIYEFPVIDLKIFGLVDRRLQQVSGKLNVQFDSLSVVLVGDFAVTSSIR